MSPDLTNIDGKQKYEVEVSGETFANPRGDGAVFKVEGSEIISAACHGSGQITSKGSEPQICDLCGGMGMFDYSKASKITVV